MDHYREGLKDVICNDCNKPSINKTSCGVNGSFVVERLLGTDLLFSSALVTEGLFTSTQKISSPSDFEVFVYPERYNEENMVLARAIILEMEINLAANAPYDVTYIDGSLTTTLIHIYKAVSILKNGSNPSFMEK